MARKKPDTTSTASLAVATLPAEPPEREKAALQAGLDRTRAARPIVRLKTDGTKAKIDHPDELTGLRLLVEGFGSTSADFAYSLLDQIANMASKGGEINEANTNFAVAIVAGLEPRDQVEAMLAAQMAASHMAVMTFARRLSHVETIQQQDSAQNSYNKLARTFAAQVDTLKRYRSTGEQKVTVQHVNVGEGGQAIVGDVYRGGEGQ